VKSSIGIPTLVTAHLTLRGHTVADFDASAAMWAEPEIVRFISGIPSTREESWGRLLRYAGLWALLGYGYWLVEETATGRFAGEVGFAEFRRDLILPVAKAPEIGWVLAPWAQGRGWAREAVGAALAWGDRNWSPSRSICLIVPDNAPSIRLAQKSGFGEVGEIDYKSHPTLVFCRS
jgi:RimJ/RimL family protein N-acetyltransferase